MIDCSVAEVTTNETEVVWDPRLGFAVAVIVTLPGVTPETRPELLIVATDGSEVAKLNWFVISCDDASVKIPAPITRKIPPAATDGFSGNKTMLCSVAAVTVRVAVPDTPDCVAVIVAAPVPTALNRPEAEMVPTEGEAVQIAVPVTSLRVPSVKIASACSCFVVAFANWMTSGLMEILTISGAVMVIFTVAVWLS